MFSSLRERVLTRTRVNKEVSLFFGEKNFIFSGRPSTAFLFRSHGLAATQKKVAAEAMRRSGRANQLTLRSDGGCEELISRAGPVWRGQ